MSSRLVDMGDDVQEVLGSNPGTIYCMDITLLHIDLLQILYRLFENTESKQ